MDKLRTMSDTEIQRLKIMTQLSKKQISQKQAAGKLGISVLQVPAKSLRVLIGHKALSDPVLAKMTERLARTSINELPRFAGINQQDAQELRAAPSH